MIPFVDCNEIVFRGTFILLLVAAFVVVVCFSISLSYWLSLMFFVLESICTIILVLLF